MASRTGTTTLPSSLTITYLKGLQDMGKIDDLQALGNEHDNDYKSKLVEYLKSNGVQDVDDDDKTSLEDCQAAIKRMVHPKFWVIHASLHPNYRRVKNWLWVHEQYRTKLAKIQTQKEFNKYHCKVERHSEYEETQLFQFFRDMKLIDSTILDQLTEQHENTEIYDTIQNGYSKSDNGSIKTLLESYRKELLDHLQLEEEVIVGPWLQLTEEQYRTYRTYLSWKYRFVY